MTRHAPALLALSIVAVAGWTCNVNYDTRAALDRLSALRTQIAEEREAMQVLRVEWAYLNAPDRLAGLVAAHNDALGLMPLLPESLGIAAAVPYPPREAPDTAPVMPEALIAAGPPAAPDRSASQAGARRTFVAADALMTAGPLVEPSLPLRAAPGATGRAASVRPDTETVIVAALGGTERAEAAPPAVLAGSDRQTAAVAAPIPAAVEPATGPAIGPATGPATGAETVPAALEAAIAAALVEVGVQVTDAARPGIPTSGVIAVSAGPSGILGVAAAGVPVPSARPVAWSGR
jgi:hypothetical protein